MIQIRACALALGTSMQIVEEIRRGILSLSPQRICTHPLERKPIPSPPPPPPSDSPCAGFYLSEPVIP